MTNIKLTAKSPPMQQEAYWENLVKRSLCRFLLLAELERGPVHGYGINQAIKEACQGCCEPTEAMVYSTMKELIEAGYVVWGAFKSNTRYFDPATKPFMFNLIVDDVDGALAQIEAGGASIIGEVETHENGRFGWFLDPEGNKVELWESNPTGAEKS